MDKSPKKKGKTFNGKTAEQLMREKHMIMFRLVRTVQKSVTPRVRSLSKPKDVTDTIAIVAKNGNFIIAGTIESPKEPHHLKKRGIYVAAGRAIAKLNGKQLTKAPQSIMQVSGPINIEHLEQFIHQLGEYDFAHEKGFPYQTIEHKGTKNRPISDSLAFIVQLCNNRLKPVL